MQGDQERCLAAGMDGYIAKPLRAEELVALIERLLLRAASPALPPIAPPLDLPAALHAMDGDRDLLVEVMTAFCQDYPCRITELREAIGHEDASQVERSAHSLKGALAIVGATRACTLAAELEALGRAPHLENSAIVLSQLEQELDRVAAFLAEPGWDGRICGVSSH